MLGWDLGGGVEEVRLSLTGAGLRRPKSASCVMLARLSPRLQLAVRKSRPSARAAVDAATERLGEVLRIWREAGDRRCRSGSAAGIGSEALQLYASRYNRGRSRRFTGAHGG